MTDEEEDERYRRQRERDEREALLDDIAYALGCLADNLGIAAALCHAYRLGALDVAEAVYRQASAWWPGCGRPAP